MLPTPADAPESSDRLDSPLQAATTAASRLCFFCRALNPCLKELSHSRPPCTEKAGFMHMAASVEMLLAPHT